MLSSSDAESVADRRPARARARRGGAAPRAAARLHRVGRRARARGPRSLAIYETVVAGRRRRRRGRGGGHLRRLPRAPRAGRPRRRRDALLRVGAPGRALGRRDGDRVAALGGGRLGARPRRARARAAARHEARLRQHARTTRPGMLMSRGGARRASSSSAPSAAPGSSATRSTASSSTTRPTACRPRATSTSARSRSARCRRPTGCPACASAGSPRRDRDALAAHRRPQALHDDLLERAERAPQRARAPASRRARRPQPRDRAREPAAARRVLRAARRAASRGCGRPRARSGSRALHGVEDATAFCEQLVADEGVLLLPGAVYDEPGHVRVGFGRADMPEALAAARALASTRVLNPAEATLATRTQGFRTTCRYTLLQTTQLPRGGALQWVTDRGSRRGSSGTASRGEALELGHAEASSYATARYVEEQNRAAAREWRAA